MMHWLSLTEDFWWVHSEKYSELRLKHVNSGKCYRKVRFSTPAGLAKVTLIPDAVHEA
jgi:hypothetical protein